MKRKLFFLVLLLPAVAVAGAWTRVSNPHVWAKDSAAVTSLAGSALSLLASAIELVSRIAEPAWFLFFGLCFVSLALVLHRKSVKQREQ